MQRLNDKRIFLTAAGQGIGKACAIAFLNEGAEVIASDINGDLLEKLKQDYSCLSVMTLDVTDPVAVKSIAEQIGHIDILFNCAGYVHHGSILECSEEDWQCSMDINIHAMFRITKAFLPMMVQQGAGNIINMSSVASSIKGAQNRFAYGTTKAAVIGLTKSIAADFVHQGIRCNAICPGTVQSPSLEERIATQGGSDAVRQAFIDRQPMGRIGKPEEIAALATYLASDESGYTTGVAHVIDGGWSI